MVQRSLAGDILRILQLAQPGPRACTRWTRDTVTQTNKENIITVLGQGDPEHLHRVDHAAVIYRWKNMMFHTQKKLRRILDAAAICQ